MHVRGNIMLLLAAFIWGDDLRGTDGLAWMAWGRFRMRRRAMR